MTKTVIIIGGTGEIGTAVCRRFSETGYSIAAVSRHPRTSSACPTIEHELFVAADVADPRSLRAAFDAVCKAFGTVNAIIYTPGRIHDSDVPISDYSLQDWGDTYAVYVTGFFLTVKEALGCVPSGGHVVAISSAVTRFQSAALPALHLGPYASAKAALDEFCKWARRDLHERGILLSRIAPGAVDVRVHRAAPVSKKPPALIPMADLVERIVKAVLDGKEIDERIVAIPTAAGEANAVRIEYHVSTNT